MPSEWASVLFEDEVAAGEDTMVLWPGRKLLRGGHPTIILCHAAGAQESAVRVAQVLSLCKGGFTVLMGDFGGTLTFANDLMQTRTGQTLTWARAEGISDDEPVVIIGMSMGSAGGLAWARDNLSEVRGHISVAGLYDIEDVHANNRGSQAANIDAAYGGSWSNVTDGPTHNPAVFVDDVAGIPIHTFFASDDDLTLPSVEADFAEAHGNVIRTNLGAVTHGGSLISMGNMDLLEAVREVINRD